MQDLERLTTDKKGKKLEAQEIFDLTVRINLKCEEDKNGNRKKNGNTNENCHDRKAIAPSVMANFGGTRICGKRGSQSWIETPMLNESKKCPS
jgi:hypothetical protein